MKGLFRAYRIRRFFAAAHGAAIVLLLFLPIASPGCMRRTETPVPAIYHSSVACSHLVVIVDPADPDHDRRRYHVEHQFCACQLSYSCCPSANSGPTDFYQGSLPALPPASRLLRYACAVMSAALFQRSPRRAFVPLPAAISTAMSPLLLIHEGQPSLPRKFSACSTDA